MARATDQKLWLMRCSSCCSPHPPPPPRWGHACHSHSQWKTKHIQRTNAGLFLGQVGSLTRWLWLEDYWLENVKRLFLLGLSPTLFLPGPSSPCSLQGPHLCRRRTAPTPFPFCLHRCFLQYISYIYNLVLVSASWTMWTNALCMYVILVCFKETYNSTYQTFLFNNWI